MDNDLMNATQGNTSTIANIENPTAEHIGARTQTESVSPSGKSGFADPAK